MSDWDKEVETLALRQQIVVLERQLGKARPRFSSADLAFLAALLHRLPRDVPGRFRLLMRPETVLRIDACTVRLTRQINYPPGVAAIRLGLPSRALVDASSRSPISSHPIRRTPADDSRSGRQERQSCTQQGQALWHAEGTQSAGGIMIGCTRYSNIGADLGFPVSERARQDSNLRPAA